MGQVCFETMADIVDRLHVLLDNRLDNHGRNSLMASFVHYVFRPPDADTKTNVTGWYKPYLYFIYRVYKKKVDTCEKFYQTKMLHS